MWLVYVMQYTAEELKKPITETARILEKHGFIEKVLNGYEAFHTQGFEYMAELLKDELNAVQGVESAEYQEMCKNGKWSNWRAL